MKYVAVYVGSNDELNFFCRMIPGLKVNGLKFIFVSNKLSIIVKLLLRGEKVFVVRTSENMKDIPELNKCFDLRSGITTSEKAKILYSSIYNTFNILAVRYSLEYVFIWNGLSVQTLAVAGVCKARNLRSRFFELANLQDKIFVNPHGVNAMSGLYEHPEILDRYNCSEEEYHIWRENYILQKMANDYFYKFKKVNYLFLLDVFAFRYFRIPENGETRIHKKFQRYFTEKPEIIFDEYDIINRKYIFLPLQINLDTQILFNSDYSNAEAVKTGMKMAEETDADLVVKLHPGETDTVFIKMIYEMKNRIKFFLVNYTTIDLILYSECVLTINSTVGLEAMIVNKPVVFLGRSFYTKLKGHYLKNYIIKYLVEGNYYSDKIFSVQSVERILNIC